jgi:hypothetical protein
MPTQLTRLNVGEARALFRVATMYRPQTKINTRCVRPAFIYVVEQTQKDSLRAL